MAIVDFDARVGHLGARHVRTPPDDHEPGGHRTGRDDRPPPCPVEHDRRDEWRGEEEAGEREVPRVDRPHRADEHAGDASEHDRLPHRSVAERAVPGDRDSEQCGHHGEVDEVWVHVGEQQRPRRELGDRHRIRDHPAEAPPVERAVLDTDEPAHCTRHDRGVRHQEHEQHGEQSRPPGPSASPLTVATPDHGRASRVHGAGRQAADAAEGEVHRKRWRSAQDPGRDREQQVAAVVVVERPAREPRVVRRQCPAAEHRREHLQLERLLAAARRVPQVRVGSSQQHEGDEPEQRQDLGLQQLDPAFGPDFAKLPASSPRDDAAGRHPERDDGGDDPATEREPEPRHRGEDGERHEDEPDDLAQPGAGVGQPSQHRQQEHERRPPDQLDHDKPAERVNDAVAVAIERLGERPGRRVLGRLLVREHRPAGLGGPGPVSAARSPRPVGRAGRTARRWSASRPSAQIRTSGWS